MGTCSTCRHWERDIDSTNGTCLRVNGDRPQKPDTCAWVRAPACEGLDELELRTQAAFGCVGHEPGADIVGDGEYGELLALAVNGTPRLNETACRMFEHILKRLGPPASLSSDRQTMCEAVEIEGAIPNRTVREALRFLLSQDAPPDHGG